MINPAQFIAQVRTEGRKVVWPTKRETGITTLMVFLLSVLAAIFFFFVDLVLRTGVNGILGL